MSRRKNSTQNNYILHQILAAAAAAAQLLYISRGFTAGKIIKARIRVSLY
jgi:hypothetical protein